MRAARKQQSGATAYEACLAWTRHLVALLILTVSTSVASANSPLVSANWVLSNLESEGVVFVDLQPVNGYARVHLPNAVNTQYGAWRQRRPVEGKALPDIAYLEKLLGSLGIAPTDHIVLTPIGMNASEIAVATRIYWTLKVIGHEKVSILDGGLIAYSRLPKPIFTKQATRIRPAKYTANPNPALAPSMDDVLSAWKKGTAFFDYRSHGEYVGKAGGPRPGTIPGAQNLPFDQLVEPQQGGKFLTPEQVKALFSAQGMDPMQAHIGFCNSGHRASLAWFVTHELLGNKQGLLYDGSMAEWQQHPDNPIVLPK